MVEGHLISKVMIHIILNDDQKDATILAYLFIPNQLYMFRVTSSSIIRRTWLYLQHLIMSTGIAAGWCHQWDGTATILAYLFITNQLYMYRATYSPIIRRTWLYLQHLILSTGIAAGWCHEWDGTATILAYLCITNQLYMFRVTSSPIIRSTWLYLQHLIFPTGIAAGTSQQQYRWTISDAVNTVKCSWWWRRHHPKHIELISNK